MDWILATIVSALLFVATALLSKDIMEDVSPVFFTSVTMGLSTVFYTPVFLYYFSTGLIPSVQVLIGFILFSLTANILGYFSYNYALKNSPVSEVMPLNRLQPVFVAIIGFIALNEALNLRVSTGIILATLGGYIVLLKNPHHLMTPFKDIFRNRGEQFAILSAVAFGFAAVADRYITTQIPPEIHTFFILTGIALAFNLLMYRKNGKNHLKQFRNEVLRRKNKYILIGSLQAVSFLTIFMALSMQEASKVVPLLQIQVPLTVLAGGALFNEDHILLKLVGSAILVTGVILVAV